MELHYTKSLPNCGQPGAKQDTSCKENCTSMEPFAGNILSSGWPAPFIGPGSACLFGIIFWVSKCHHQWSSHLRQKLADWKYLWKNTWETEKRGYHGEGLWVAGEWGRREADFSLYTCVLFQIGTMCIYCSYFLNVPEKTQVWSLLRSSLFSLYSWVWVSLQTPTSSHCRLCLQGDSLLLCSPEVS